MASLEQIRQALADTIRAGTQTEISVYDTVEDLVEVPAVIIEPLNCDFATAMKSGSDYWKLHIFVLVGRTNNEDAQHQLDGFLSGSGPDSIRRIIFDNCDLGLPDTDAMVKAMRGYGGHFEVAKIPHIGAVLMVEVETSGTS